MRQFYMILVSLFSTLSFSQTKILLYHETNGFRHSGAINNGITMFEAFGTANGFTVDNTQDSSVFTTNNLAQYAAVVFLNTSGNDLLTTAEKIAFETFIASGKGFIGIHAATDTYRNGDWDFYNELVGAIVQTGPNHTSNNFNADISVLASHPATDALVLNMDMKWNKNEEYYYWQNNGGQLSTDNTVLLEVEQTGSNSYDAARPITWYKESVTYDDDDDNSTPKLTMSGVRSFYTALGHNGSDYSGDSNFRDMLLNATLWAIANTLSIDDVDAVPVFKLAPNPVVQSTTIQFKNQIGNITFKLYNVLGKEVLVKSINTSQLINNRYELDLSDLNNGIYILKLHTDKVEKSVKLVKI